MNNVYLLLGLIAINISLFLSLFFINFQESKFFPDLTRLNRWKGKGLWLDYNLDPFRASVDLTLLIYLVHITKSEYLIVFATCYYAFLQIFNLYHCSFRKIYGSHPAIVNDWKLLKTGLGFIYGESKWKLLLYTVAAIVVLYATSLMVFHYVSWSTNIDISLLFLAIGALFFCAYIVKTFVFEAYNPVFDLAYRFVFIPYRLYGNLQLSRAMIKTANSLNEKSFAEDKSKSLVITHKPNVHFICVESYGSILFNSPELRTDYVKLLNEFKRRLGAIGHHTSSNLSRSVSLVGPSWLAYSTLLLGTKIESNYEYEYLLANEPSQFPTIAKTLKRNGYVSYNVNQIKPRAGISVPYKKIMELYGIDEFILYDDIPFNGSAFGISESPPDQYVLNYTRDEILSRQDRPYFLFYLTKNSHSPFISPTTISNNWRELNNGKPELIGNKFLQIPTSADYLKAIKYQLESILDYISGFDSGKNLFVVVGDHQPHHIVHSNDYGLETPLHIISENKEFVRSFEKYGFKKDIQDVKNQINHEDLRSILETEMQHAFK